MKKFQKIGFVVALMLMLSPLAGCVTAVALVPAALNLAAEGVSVQTTGQTITENLRDVINESRDNKVEVARKVPPLPPRKPTPPLAITTPVSGIGIGFIK